MGALSEQERKRQTAHLARGVEALYTPAELEARLGAAAEAGRPLRVKLGLDPTAPDIHLGHTVVLGRIRQFQDLGHKAVLIIGDYTARIGDPSGANKTRPMLSPEQIDANAATYIAQAGKVIDLSPDRLEIRRNSEWLEKLTMMELLRLAGQMTVARMMERDTFELRYRDGVPIGVHEFVYPLLQGYDSVVVRADVELGGTDQTFNNLVGRDIQKSYDQPPQIVMVLPILVGLDGVEKMSKSKGNYVGVTDEPNDMFGKIMSIPDTLMANYFMLLTALPPGEVAALTDPRQTHPRQAKERLGKLIVERYHDRRAADAAAEEFARVFAQKQAPTEMPDIAAGAAGIGVIDLIMRAGFADSRSAARRLVEQGAVSLDAARLDDPNAVLDLRAGQVLRVGKRRFGRIAPAGG